MAYNQYRPQNGPQSYSAPQQRHQQPHPGSYGPPHSSGRPAQPSAYNQNGHGYNSARGGNAPYSNGQNDRYYQNGSRQGGYGDGQKQYQNGVGQYKQSYEQSREQVQDQNSYDDESEYEDDVYEEPWEEQNYQQSQQQMYNNQSRPPLQHAQTYAAPTSHGGRSYQPPRDQQRMSMDQESPKTAAWDNPFGAFPASRKKNGEADNAQGSERRAESRAADGRPSTSQGNRQRTEPPRPHTSHEQRARGGNNAYAQPAFDPRRQQNHDADIGSGRNGQSSRPQPQRAMTGPAPQSSAQSMPVHRHSAENDSRGIVSQQLDRDPSTQVQRGYDNNQSFNSQSLRTSPSRSRFQEGTSVNNANTQQYLPQDNVDPSTYRGVPMSKKTSIEVPNFDAISPVCDQRTEHDLVTSSQTPSNAAYYKPTYQPADSRRPNSQEQQNGNEYEAEQLVSPLAQFSFGTSEQSSAPPAQQGPSQTQPNQTYDNGQQQQSSGSEAYRPVPQTTYQAEPLPATNFPPRGASRATPSGPPPSRGYDQSFPGPGSAPPPRRPMYDPRNDRGGGNNVPPMARGNGQRPNYSENRGNSRQGPAITNQRPPLSNGQNQSTQRAGFDPRLQPRTASLPSSQQQPSGPRQQTPNQQQHPGANGQDYRSNSGISSSNMPGRAPSDSSRPVPFRPGLQQSTPSTSSAAYTNVPSTVPARDTQPRPVEVNNGPVTIQELNMLRETFKGNPNDHKLGLRFAKRLVEAANVLASEGGRADPKQTDRNRERYVLDAHKIVKRLIDAGDPESMFYMADCYGQGLLGLQPDQKEAFSLYQSAAKLGHAASAYRVAVCCELGAEDGGGTRRDLQKAAQWYKRAADLGDVPGMYKMGTIQLKGLLDQPRSPQNAVAWLKKAAERADADNPHALHELGLLYETAQPGDVIQRDEKYALQLFTQAADLGYKYSQFRLGCAYEYGHMGCEIDSRRSIAWYTRAASQGEHQSEFALSGWYLTGSGPPPPGERVLLEQSDTEAYLWAKRAATSGLVTAEFAMGYYSEVGIGTKVNIEEAKKWYFRAAAQNHPKARERLEELKRGGPRMQKGAN